MMGFTAHHRVASVRMHDCGALGGSARARRVCIRGYCRCAHPCGAAGDRSLIHAGLQVRSGHAPICGAVDT
eukprot:6933866-Pyramimonas_sp.AAC.1